MKSQIFTYLKLKKVTNVRTVNRLFVSVYVVLSNIDIKRNSFIKDLLIRKEEKEYIILQDFLEKFKFRIFTFSLEDLITLFEFVISPIDRIVTGAVYTPHNVRKRIIDTCLSNYNNEQLTNIRLADISCGCGGFLIDAAKYIHEKTGSSFYKIFTKNIYGIDLKDYSVERTKILLSLLALTYGEDINFKFNILVADTLDYKSASWNNSYNNFDVIVGNPPYVCSRKVSDETKQKMLQYEVCQSGHPDLYIPFFQIATMMLCNHGILGFITMNSFIRSLNGRSVRDYFSKGQHKIHIIDFRGYQIFNHKNTYTCLFFLKKNSISQYIYYSVDEQGSLNENISYINIPYKKLDNKKGWNLNDNEEVIKIESIGTPLGKYSKTRHGIATLSNNTYIFKPIKEDDSYYYIENNGISYPIEKLICRDIVNSNKLNSDINFESIIEKVIFPYTEINGKITIIDENTMQTIYPCVYKYLLSKRDLLNERDKGHTKNYPAWYAFGRTQSLVMPRYKLFFPKFANKSLHCVIIDDANLMLYNGMTFISENLQDLKILKKILESNIFWRYIVKNAKPYSSGYYSLSGVDIKKFGIPNFKVQEKEELLSIQKQEDINKWLYKYYT